MPRLQDNERMTLTLDGGGFHSEVFKGTAEEVVSQMTASSIFRQHESSAEYMRGYARRSAIMGMEDIATINPESFVESLIWVGIAIRSPFK